MLYDLENNHIEIQQVDNRSIGIYGASGTGKTNVACRLIEKYAAEMPVIIVDHSASYTEEELKDHSVPASIIVSVQDFQKHTCRFELPMDEEDALDNIADAIIEALNISAKTQWEQLKEACISVYKKKNYITMALLYNELESMSKDIEDSEEKKNLYFLLKRMYHIRKNCFLEIAVGYTEWKNGIHLMQMSWLSERARKDIVRLVLELLWCKARRNIKGKPIQIVLDEYQNLQISGTSLERMLREGRRFDLGIILISQFLPCRTDRKIVQQAYTTLYFRQDETTVELAKSICASAYKEMEEILRNLKRGMCVLKGNYYVNGRPVSNPKPIVCRVV